MAKSKRNFSPKDKSKRPDGVTDTARVSAEPTDANGTGWVRRTIVAELLSDAHPGSGSGGGGVDALVARDRQGRPVIWASHVEGVLRDAARRLRGNDVASGFFGRAGGDRQRAVFTSLYAAADPGSHVWRSTAREAFDNRAPKGETLRVVEYVPKGTKFTGQVELPASELPLLHRLLQEVDALGGGRATGTGRVKLTLAERERTPRSVGNVTGRLVLLLKNVDPLCITATATPDNLIPSLAFVPGRSLLGALAAWLIAEGHRDVASLLVDGRVSVSDALPVPREPQRLSTAEILPAPLSLQSEKPAGDAGPVPWWARPKAATRRLDAWGAEGTEAKKQGAKLRRPEDDLFVYRPVASEPWATFRPSRRVRLRNGRPDPKQVDSSLFAIEQIVEDTLFLCELRGSRENMARLASELGPVLEGRRWLRVGRAGAPVEVVQLGWSSESSPAPIQSPALLTLTSDLLVRDEHLRWCSAVDQARLQQLPGWPSDVTVKSLVQDSVMVHGFNGTSRLWRMPAAAVRRGSVFEVSGDGVVQLAQMAASGNWLGERTHEGFGRFRLDTTLPGVTSGTPSSTSSASVDDAAEEAAAATTRTWFEAHRALAKPGSSTDRRPSLSQWLDLVADLDRRDPNAISSRLKPTTAGAQAWKHRDAKAVLEKLKALPKSGAPTLHARLFVRWLRAALRKEAA